MGAKNRLRKRRTSFLCRGNTIILDFRCFLFACLLYKKSIFIYVFYSGEFCCINWIMPDFSGFLVFLPEHILFLIAIFKFACIKLRP
jgi:hypothetical protein